MSRPWRLTRQAEASLVDIARWTLATFGARQAAVYEDDLARLHLTPTSHVDRHLTTPELPAGSAGSSLEPSCLEPRWKLGSTAKIRGAQECLVGRCIEIAEGTAMSRGCRQLIDSALPEELRFARCGQHFIVFVEYSDRVIIVDFLHARSDLPGRLAAFADSERGRGR